MSGEGRPDDASWFAVRCIFRHDGVYEERVTLWRTDSFGSAIALAETEAAEYGEALGHSYCGLAQSYALADETPGHGCEVFSLIRESELEPNEYLSRFFDTGAELQGTVDDQVAE
jgi:hypothetical protein